MCGICGILYTSATAAPTEAALRAMNGALIHRGPDGDGFYLGEAVALAMRRLSIIDVAGSRQPLYNEDRTIVVVFNGEIFNFRALRAHLAARGHHYHTAGDGEVIAHLYEEYGDDAPRHLRGQFAFALWDSRQRRLLLARDIMGEKPLYYTRQGDVFAWASEIKALRQHPGLRVGSALHKPERLAEYLTFGCIAAPHTACDEVLQVPPAHRLTVQDGQVRVERYWQLPASAPPDPRARAEDYLPVLRSALETAVELTMIADVPLGAFLSGGLDSSLIVALMQRRASQPVRTFSIGFEGDDSFDETPYARRVARLLGTQHIEFRVQPSLMALLPDMVRQHDQPFGDSSALPTLLVSRLTREHVTVALTGDGGDELFAGYERFYAATLIDRLRVVPPLGWKALAWALEKLPEGTGYHDRIKRAGRFARAASLSRGAAYLDMVRIFTPQQIAALLGHSVPLPTADIASPQALLRYNLETYLPDDLLVKTDRMTMMASLEARAPFLLQEVVELAFRIPFNLKLRGSVTKYILKQLALEYLPEAIVHRPKHGFGVPLGAWLRRDSRILRDLLLAPGGRIAALLNTATVAEMIAAHERGQRDHSRRLWALLTLETWLSQMD
jgi:asparagine synthase (glutamine-hydrolysing)